MYIRLIFIKNNKPIRLEYSTCKFTIFISLSSKMINRTKTIKVCSPFFFQYRIKFTISSYAIYRFSINKNWFTIIISNNVSLKHKTCSCNSIKKFLLKCVLKLSKQLMISINNSYTSNRKIIICYSTVINKCVIIMIFYYISKILICIWSIKEINKLSFIKITTFECSFHDIWNNSIIRILFNKKNLSSFTFLLLSLFSNTH